MDVNQARVSLERKKISDEQRELLDRVQASADHMLIEMYGDVEPCPELTLAARKLEEAVMWHAKAVKSQA